MVILTPAEVLYVFAAKSTNARPVHSRGEEAFQSSNYFHCKIERWFAMAVFSKQRMRMYACISMAMEILYFTSFSTYLPELHLKDAVASITTFSGHTLSTSAIDLPTIQTSLVSNSSLQPASSKDSAVLSTQHIHKRSLVGAVSNTTLGVSATC